MANIAAAIAASSAWTAEAPDASQVSAVKQDDDIIELNVGGRHVSTTRGMLRQEECFLTGIFSGRWEESVRTDKQGRVFLDYDPDCFETMLYHLRLSRLSGNPVDWRSVKPPCEKEEYFRAFLTYLGITQEDAQQQELTYHRFGKNCVVELENDRVATLASDGAFGGGWAISAAAMQSGISTWGFRLNHLPADGEVMLGVIGCDSPLEPESLFDANGWESDGFVRKTGQQSASAGPGFQCSDVVRMRFDSDQGALQMKVDRIGEEVFEIWGLDRYQRVHAWLCGKGTSVELFASGF